MKVKANKIVLSREQIADYETFGYLIVPDVFSVTACEEIKRMAAQFADDDYSVYLNLHRDSQFFLEIMKGPYVVDHEIRLF